MRAEERGGRQAGFMVAVMQKCKHFATFAENNDTAGRGRCARAPVCFCCLQTGRACRRACVRACVRERQQHRGERKENVGGEMRGEERERGGGVEGGTERANHGKIGEMRFLS